MTHRNRNGRDRQSTHPTWREVLELLDGEIDRFNGDHDPGPTDHFLYPRLAMWRRPVKYQADSYNECLTAFFDCCAGMSFPVSESEGLLEAMATSLRLEDQGSPDPIGEKRIAATVDAVRRDFEERPDVPVEALDGHWVRIMAWVKPELLAPVAAWGHFMHTHLERSERNFRGGSKNWTLDNHEDGNAPYKALLRALEARGWYTPGQPLSAREAEQAEEAERRFLKRHRITVVKRDEEDRWVLDPTVVRWVTWSELKERQGPGVVFISHATTKVLQLAGFWTEEERKLADENRRKLREGLIATPPIPEGEQPVTERAYWADLGKRD